MVPAGRMFSRRRTASQAESNQSNVEPEFIQHFKDVQSAWSIGKKGRVLPKTLLQLNHDIRFFGIRTRILAASKNRVMRELRSFR